MKHSKTSNLTKYQFDASDQILGRLASKIALILRGKDKPNFTPNKTEMELEITIYNTDQLKFSGNKLEDKKYYWHSGHPGGIKERTLKEFMQKDSCEVLRKAIYGMLPKNKLRDRLIQQLKLFKGSLS